MSDTQEPILITVKPRQHYLKLFEDDAEGNPPSFSLGEGLQITTELLLDTRDFMFSTMNSIEAMRGMLVNIHNIAVNWHKSQQQVRTIASTDLPFDITKLRTKQ